METRYRRREFILASGVRRFQSIVAEKAWWNSSVSGSRRVC